MITTPKMKLFLALFALISAWLCQTYELSEETYEINQVHRVVNQHPTINMFERWTNSYIATYEDWIFFVFIDTDLRPIVGGFNRAQYVFNSKNLDEDTSFTIPEDHDYLFSIGIDENGYLHVTGKMNDYPLREDPSELTNHHCLIWRSKEPLDVSEWEFRGDDASKCPQGTGFKNLKFFNNPHTRELYLSYRVHLKASLTADAGLGISRYDVDTEIWEPCGGETAVIFSPRSHETIPPYYASVIFDNDSTMHLAAAVPAADSDGEENHYVIYAKSHDGGRSFVRIDESPISVPMEAGSKGAFDPDIILQDEILPPICTAVTIDEDGFPNVIIQTSPTKRLIAFGSSEWLFRDEWEDLDFASLRDAYLDKMGVTTLSQDGDTYQRAFDIGSDEVQTVDCPTIESSAHEPVHLWETGNIVLISGSTDILTLSVNLIERPSPYPPSGVTPGTTTDPTTDDTEEEDTTTDDTEEEEEEEGEI
eukprot:GHVO01042649.1.p1 GENE.GHVO01042649.1~~GHVO01042649.1.p1  ORF type:complete len:478 (+),score=49.31 GHVO01042649.1:392-1825(+)